MDIEKASVLVPIINRQPDPTVVFILRSHKVKHHKGQVSFPGGSVHVADQSTIHTALRETEEEIGIKSDTVKIIYQLPELNTASGFHVTPVVGIISAPVELKRSPDEVKEIFEVPLSFLANKSNFKSIQLNAKTQPYTVIKYQKFTIWGVTAQIVSMLIDSIPQHANVFATENISLTL